jgi:ClpP class serine protease
LQEYIDQLTTQFHNEVKSARRLTGSASNIVKTLSGAMFPANEAKQRGLVDSIGNFQYAMKRAKKMTK